ncbi:MAG: AMP-binding protein, partial [Planctomycetota bacterium JB042]
MTFEPVDARFRRRAAEAPDATAVQSDAERVSYGALDRRVARLAGAIRAARGEEGTSAGTVGLLAAPGPDAIAALLGVLRAGGCAVPLPAAEEDAVLAATLAATGVRVLVADAEHRTRADRIADGRLVLPVRPADGTDGRTEDASVPVDPESPALVVTTSGSTGRPKGVVTRHRDLADRVDQAMAACAMVPGDRQASVIPIHFAAAFPDVFGPLTTGASLHPFDVRRRGVEALPAWVRREGITRLNLPIDLLRRWLAGADRAPLPCVRLLNLSGDRLDGAELAAAFDLLPEDARVVVGYGSSETNLIAQHAIDRIDAFELVRPGRTVPVGRPVAGKAVVLLDADGVPIEDPAADDEGEIAVAHVGRSTGGVAPAPSLHRTGDLGRIDADGALTVLGRRDARVKVRGQRVDLGAVERTIRDLADVGNAAAALRAVGGGEPRLVAWVEPAATRVPTAAAIRREVRARAPAHWVPARVVVMSSLPLTASGKVDREALPDPGRATSAREVPASAPTTPLETRLAASWGDALGVDAVGIDDRFFDLGGDSLALAALVAAAERETGTRVPPAAISADLTVRRLAEALESGGGRGDDDVRSPVSAPDRGTLVHGPYLGRRALPYGVGVRLQRAAFASGAVRRAWFADPTALVARWHARLAPDEPLEATVRRSLLANTWVEWRARALARPATFDRWVDVVGGHVLEEALADPGRGVVLAVAHTGIRHARLLRALPALAGRTIAPIHRPSRRADE